MRRRGHVSMAVGLATALVVSACSGAGGDLGSTTSPASPPAVRLLEPGAFADEIVADRRFVINVHVPDEGSIAGTDATIPFDQIEKRIADLPRSRDAALAVYCRTGRMSEIAGSALTAMGYVDVVELRGGMVAWAAAGKPLVPAKPRADG